MATVALALGTAFMQPMHAASYPLDATEVVAQAAATVAASPGAPSAGRMEQRLGQPSVLPAQTHGR